AESGFQVLLVEPPAGDGADVVNPKPLADGVFFVTPRRNSPATLRPWLEQLSEQFSDAPWIVHHPAWTPFLRDFLLTSRIIAYDCMDEWGSSRVRRPSSRPGKPTFRRGKWSLRPSLTSCWPLPSRFGHGCD